MADESVVAEVPEKSVSTRYLEVQADTRNTQNRLADLQTKSFEEGLTGDEELEQMQLERCILNLDVAACKAN